MIAKQSPKTMLSLREWDYILLDRYPPFYPEMIDKCSLCAYGECDLSGTKKGACGIDKETHTARTVLLTVVTGASGHISHARKLVSDAISKFGRDYRLDMGAESFIDTPVIRIVCGYRPEKLGDLEKALNYLETEITHLMSVINFGQENAVRDYESKSLHAGMLDSVALEVAEAAQISAYDFPKGAADTPLVELGIDTIDKNKKVIVVIGHNSSVGVEIVNYVKKYDLSDRIEVCGLCCAAAEAGRHSHSVKIVGNQAEQLLFVKSGIADVIVMDNQCIRVDLLIEADKKGSRVILTSEIISSGLIDRSTEPAASIIAGLVSGEYNAAFIPDIKKSAEISVKAALGLLRKKEERINKGEEKFNIRAGRGIIKGCEIRNIAPPVIMGEIPGIIGFAGCPGYSNGYREVQTAVEEFLSRKYIITSCGCVSFDIARNKDSNTGRSFFESTNGNFDAGCLANLGSCVSGTHLMGAAIKIASVMLHRPIDGNYQEIADYILNRVGVVLVIWGGFTQKAYATAVGANRLGIPVIFGPRGVNYSRLMVSCKEDAKKWSVHDARFGKNVSTGPAPEHLLYSAKDYTDLLITAVKLCLRPNDTTGGRRTKLTSYIEVFQKNRNEFPGDVHLYIRTEYDIPSGWEGEIKKQMGKNGWRRTYIPDPTLL